MSENKISGKQNANSSNKQMMMYDANKKSVGISYLLWFFLGGFGAHRFYMGQIKTAVGQFILLIFSSVLLFTGIGIFGYIVLGGWLIVDAFLIPGIIREHNTKLADSLG